MSVATEVRRGYVKHAGRVKIEDLQLQFKFQKENNQEETMEEELKEYSNQLKRVHMAHATAHIEARRKRGEIE